jgi:hypothetical protein
MIISIHIPKTAGRSWRAQLESEFGSRLLFDQEFEKVDSIETYREIFEKNTPRADAREKTLKAELHERRAALMRDYDVIHGHFVADKYLDIFPTTDFVAFVRDPYQQMISAYYYIKREAGDLFKKYNPTPLQFIELLSNMQAPFLGSIAIEELAMVGLTEHYERSVALFEAIFGKKISHGYRRVNTNPDRQGDAYEVDADVKEAVDRYCSADLELYQRAQKRFLELADQYGV